MMNLGDVSEKSVPKMTMVSAPWNGGVISTHTFIPHRCRKPIRVLGAVSVATACLSKGTVAAGLVSLPRGDSKSLNIEHPTGEMTVICEIKNGEMIRGEVLRMARILMDGAVF